MNTQRILNFLGALALSILFMQCTESKKQTAEHDDHEHVTQEDASTLEVQAPQLEVSEAFQQQLATVFSAYIDLKEAFVSSDPTKVNAEVATVKAAITSVEVTDLSSDANDQWEEYQTGILSSLDAIAASVEVEAQRNEFSSLSDLMYKNIKTFGLAGSTAYYQYCQMAFNNTGGYWLSDNEKIRNPYFGSKMLACGQVKEKLM